MTFLIDSFHLSAVFFHLECLLFLLEGVAHHDPTIARQVGQQCLDRFAEDPRPAAQHRITTMLLKEGAPFRAELVKFIAGAALADLDSAFVRHVAVLRCIITVETSIESRHALVTLAKRKHPIGPVRVSLSNRLPLLERWLRRGHIDMGTIIECFTEARSLHKAAGLLNLDAHPCLMRIADKSPTASKVHPWLTRALYNCSAESMYHSVAKAAKKDATRKRKAAELDLKLVPAKESSPPVYADVLRLLMWDHFGHMVTAGAVYMCNKNMLKVQSLGLRLHGPRSKADVASLRGERMGGAEPQSDLECDDCDDADMEIDATISFKLVMPNFGGKKTLRMPVGAGGRVETGLPIISLHQHYSGPSADDAIVDLKARAPSQDLLAAHVFVGWHRDHNDTMATDLWEWQEGRPCWCLPCVDVPLGFTLFDVSRVITKMMLVGARPSACGAVLPPADLEIAAHLAASGFLQRDSDHADRWLLTAQCMSNMQAWTNVKRSRRIFAVRDDMPNETLTRYELVNILQQQGWEWRLWLPKSKRRKRGAPIPAGYIKGQPKVWFSSVSSLQPKAYFLVLLAAEACGFVLPNHSNRHF